MEKVGVNALEENRDVWEATEDNTEETTFEETRRCLLTAYHSYVQNHAGYLIAITVAFIALLTTSESFIKTYGSLAFGLSVVVIGLFVIYDLLRMGYWTVYADETIHISYKYALNLFNIRNPELRDHYPNLYPAPASAILEIAIRFNLEMKAQSKHTPRIQRWRLYSVLKLHL